MSILKYIFGGLQHLFNLRVSKLALIDNVSTIHRTSRIYRKVKVANTSIGAFTYVAPKTQIVHASIGKFCSIGPECLIGLANHSLDYVSTSPIFTSKNNATGYKWTTLNSFDEFSKVTIGSDVWVGSRAIILGGVKVGNGVVIGAGSIVTKNIPDYAVVVGVPAKVIKFRFSDELIKKLLEINWWDISEKKLRENIHLFSKEIFMNDIEKLKLLIKSYE